MMEDVNQFFEVLINERKTSVSLYLFIRAFIFAVDDFVKFLKSGFT